MANKVFLIGRLTRDPDVKYANGANGQMAVARYTLAVDRRFKREGDEQGADFISCVAFGKSGEFAEKYLRKGTKIAVCGRITTGKYTNKDGQTVYATDVVVEEQEFCESKAAQAQAPAQTQAQAPAQTQAQTPANYTADDADGFLSIIDGVNDDGLPFN